MPTKLKIIIWKEKIYAYTAFDNSRLLTVHRMLKAQDGKANDARPKPTWDSQEHNLKM
jgi:hypothetical protein